MTSDQGEAVLAWLEALRSGTEARAEEAALSPPEDREMALRGLGEMLETGEDDARYWATRALAKFREEKAGDLLAQALTDEDLAVRQCAALALRENPQKQALDGLIGILEGEKGLVARLAGDALVALGEEATLALIELLENGGGASAKVEAARALALIGDRRSVSALFGLLESDSALLEHWAREGLEKMGIGMSFFSID